MSLGLPDCKIYVGEGYDRDSYAEGYQRGIEIPQEDRLKLNVHLAMMDEVSSFNAVLANFAKKYVETYPIAVKDLVRIFIGRGSTLPQIFLGKVEEIDCESEAMENYLTLKGRCIGEDLYRRLVTELYQTMKGEVIVKDLIERYSRLSHQRDGVELIEGTDTTYAELEYDKSKLKDVLDFIAKTADKAGVIGFDYRIAYDGKFEFFPRGTKTSPISLVDMIKYSNYRKTVHRIRNRIYVYGAEGKIIPSDADNWTENIICTDGKWTSSTGTTVTRDTGTKLKGNASILFWFPLGAVLPTVIFTLDSGKELNCRNLSTLHYGYRHSCWGPTGCVISGGIILRLVDTNGITATKNITVINDSQFHDLDIQIGKSARDWMFSLATFDWRKIREIRIQDSLVSGNDGYLHIDNMYVKSTRFGQNFPQYGGTSQIPLESITDPDDVRELEETDEELLNEAEVVARAEALLDWLKDPAESLTVQTEILDFGSNHLQPGDMQPIILPNENVNSTFRILSVDYRLGEEQEFPISIELGKETPLLADYLYRLRKETGTMSRLKRGI